MESLPQLSADSFSSRWSISIRPSSDSRGDDGLRLSFDTDDSDSFIEIDPDFFSRRWKSHDFDFSIPSSQAPVFSEGAIFPLHPITSPPEDVPVARPSASVLRRFLSFDSSKALLSQSKLYHSGYNFRAMPSGEMSSASLAIFRSASSTPCGVSSRLSKSTSSRSLKFKMPFLRSCVKPLKMLQRYLGFGSTCTKAEGRSGSLGGSSLRADRTFGTGAENKIDDAVLHCKNLIGKS